MELSNTLREQLRQSIQNRLNIDGEQLSLEIKDSLAKENVAAIYFSDTLLDFVAASDQESCDLSFIEQAFSPMFSSLGYTLQPNALYEELVPETLLHAEVTITASDRKYSVYIPCRTLVLLESLSNQA